MRYKVEIIKKPTILIDPDSIQAVTNARNEGETVIFHNNSSPRKGQKIIFNGHIDYRSNHFNISKSTMGRLKKRGCGLIEYKGKKYQFASVLREG